MDRDARRMLKYLRTSDLMSVGYCHYADFYDAFCRDTGWTEHRAMACLRYLTSRGYIVAGKDQYGHDVGFELEHKAYHHRYFHATDKWHFIRDSFLIPAIVSFITAVLTILATALTTDLLSRLQ